MMLLFLLMLNSFLELFNDEKYVFYAKNKIKILLSSVYDCEDATFK